MENNFEVEVSQSKLLDLSKDYIQKYVQQARSNLSEGFTDPLTLFITAKKGQELFTQLEKAVRPYAEQETRLAKGEVYKKFGCEITERVTGASYDFKACNDEIWNDLNSQIEILSQAKKEREKFLKTLTKPVADIETGNIINPPIKSGRIGLAVSVK